jgi:hypothetical protein
MTLYSLLAVASVAALLLGSPWYLGLLAALAVFVARGASCAAWPISTTL